MNIYKNQPWLVRFLKWLYWKPIYWLLGLVDTIVWCGYGMKIPESEKKFFKGRFDFICHLFRCELSMADIRMKNYQTLDEVIAELRAKTT